MDVAQYKFDGNADAVEFCPHYPYHNILAAATYTLQEGTEPSRSGSISLFSISSWLGLELVQHIETVGVFDIKWSPNGAGIHPILGQADACGSLHLYCLQPASENGAYGALKEKNSINVTSSMCLCLDWNPSATSISVAQSDGSLSVVVLEESQLCLSESWKAHNYEVWSTLFDLHQPQLLYSGSDDCCFCCWDLRESPSNLVFQNSKAHKMGVCCIAKSISNSNMLLTGSYDEHVREWDLRATSRPVNENSLNLGGGVWRIKYHPDDSSLILAACMHNGFVISGISVDGCRILENYNKHESLAYGADWQRGGSYTGEGSRKGPLVATCSFYDKLLRVWQPTSLLAC